jgi:hypothetical protein
MKALAIGACLAALSTLPAAAAMSDLCSKGQIAIIRVSTLKSAGSRACFDKAVADQIAWYRAHGSTGNRIVTAEVGDRATQAYSTKEVMTIHYDPPSASGALQPSDDGYKAFVKEFRDNSDITVEKEVCLPK